MTGALADVPRYATGPCASHAAATCKLDTRYFTLLGFEAVTADGVDWTLDPATDQIIARADLTSVPRYANGPCRGKAAGKCTFDTRAVSPSRRESVTAYGRYWNFDITSGEVLATGDLTTVARYANGPCKDKQAGMCKLDTRAFTQDGGESITAYGSYWTFDLETEAVVATGKLVDVERYAAGPCAQ